jgi:soluble lytic murein transglycosylase-like protein
MANFHPKRAVALALFALAPIVLTEPAHAMERITLRTGFSFDCVRHAPIDGKIRLYFVGSNYLDVAPAEITEVETIPDPPAPPAVIKPEAATQPTAATAEPSPSELRQLLEKSGQAHDIDADLLASVVHAESGGRARVVSRTGAEGLMQLMPATASAVGVKDAFAASENVEGGTRYLDAMLKRYHDNIALALAAYNAGPGAVDRYRGVPPFRETRAYVSRVIREFNRRKTSAQTAALAAMMTTVKIPVPKGP